MLACNTQTIHRGMFYSDQLIYCNCTKYSLSPIIPAKSAKSTKHWYGMYFLYLYYRLHLQAPTCQTRLAISWRCVLTRDLTKHLHLCAPNVAKVIIARIITITDGPPASPLPLSFLDQTLRVQVQSGIFVCVIHFQRGKLLTNVTIIKIDQEIDVTIVKVFINSSLSIYTISAVRVMST